MASRDGFGLSPLRGLALPRAAARLPLPEDESRRRFYSKL
jgi:hypothetical protein